MDETVSIPSFRHDKGAMVCYRQRSGCLPAGCTIDQVVYQQVVYQQVALSGKERRKYRVPSTHKYKPADMHHHQTAVQSHRMLLCEQDAELHFQLALNKSCYSPQGD